MSRTVSMPLRDWPAADQAMWSALITGDDPFGEVGALSHLRATSCEALIKHYGRWLEWLFQTEPDLLLQPPGLRATPQRLAAWIASLSHVAPPTLHTFVFGVLRVLKASAPDLDWHKQTLAANRLQRAAKRSSSDRKIGRVLSSAVLLDAAIDLAGTKAARANTPLNAALMRRDGTMMAFLSLVPVRLRSLTELELGASVLQSGRRIVINLSPDMMKNGHAWEAPVPATLEPILRAYIDEVRPWLMQRHGAWHNRLWVGRLGTPLAYERIANSIPLVTERELGISISPHLFRDSAATTLVRQSPESTRLIRPLLAHRSDEIAERHYIHATGLEAGRNYARVVDSLTRKDP